MDCRVKPGNDEAERAGELANVDWPELRPAMTENVGDDVARISLRRPLRPRI